MFKNITRGGQTFIHNITMILQIAGTLFISAILTFTVVFAATVYLSTSSEMYTLSKKWGEAMVRVEALRIFPSGQIFMFTDSLNEVEYNDEYFEAAEFIAQVEQTPLQADIVRMLLTALILALIAVFLVTGAIISFFKRRGKKIAMEKLVRGGKIATPQELTALLKQRKMASSYILGGIPMVKNSEIQHIIKIGTIGTGKTVSFSDFLTQVRKKNQRAVVYDPLGHYAERFYREGKDIILNPFDARMPYWDIWKECEAKQDYSLISKALIPAPAARDAEFWVDAARTLFENVAYKMQVNQEFDTPKLLKHLLMADLTKLSELVKGTEAESLATEQADKLALSVKAVLANYLKGLQFLPTRREGLDEFSIRQWAKQEDDDSWIFVTSTARHHETLRPLISTWMELVSSSIISLKRSSKRRIFIAMDELPTLHKLPSLSQTAAVGRNYGVCLILGAQSFSQFHKYYGEHAAKEIINQCNTMMVFRANEFYDAQYVSKLFGECEVDVTNDTTSYSANSNRDSISVGTHQKIKPVVMASEVQLLDDLNAYIKLKGDIPITKVKLTYKDYPVIAEAFIERKIDIQPALENKVASKAQPSETVNNNKLITSSNNEQAGEPISTEDVNNKSDFDINPIQMFDEYENMYDEDSQPTQSRTEK